MNGESSYSPYLIIGKLSRDFILTPEGKDLNDIPGGHLLYTAVGMSPWEKSPGLIARAGKNFPRSFIDYLSKYGLNTGGIKVLDIELEHRNFLSYFDSGTAGTQRNESVLSQYFRAGKSFPKELLGYNSSSGRTDSMTERTSATVLSRDIPRQFLEARCIHLCPLDYLSHNLLPQVFSGDTKRTISMQAGSGYMNPYFYDPVKTLVNGLTAFITHERDLRNLFAEHYRIHDTREMIRILLDYGAENIVVRMEDGSYYFINRADRAIKCLKNKTPEISKKTGELSCFCGAYLVGINETYNYKKAVAYGAARASMLKNDISPLNNLDVFDALLNEKIRIMENMIED